MQKYIWVCVVVLSLLVVTACNSVTISKVPESITVTPSDTTIKVANTQQYMAVAHYADGRTANITGDVTWSSLDDSPVVHLDVLGLARAQAEGSATVVARLGEVRGEATITTTLTTPVYPLPYIPEKHYSAIRCTVCHAEGIIEAPLFPDSHAAGYTNEMCEGCHPAS